ncbi:hypothetical protein B0H14DRAFT_2580578 [Mycena olivaceomarginata]|nr:hypothetical protein B0H14DRAFT_2580578 [Mycena olivaceomarginata]
MPANIVGGSKNWPDVANAILDPKHIPHILCSAVNEYGKPTPLLTTFHKLQPRKKIVLVITTRIIGVLRPNTLGIEQCTFDRDRSRGVLDSIRISLGLVRATSLQRGQHEDLELADTKTLAPGHLNSKKGQDVFAPEASLVEYDHRTVRFITLRGERIHYSPDGSKPDITFMSITRFKTTERAAASDVSWDPTPAGRSKNAQRSHMSFSITRIFHIFCRVP